MTLDQHLTVTEHDRLLPTLPGKVRGIVAVNGEETTVQCEACLRTATGKNAWWVIVANQWNHARSSNETIREHTPYKRCPDCRAAGRHPEEREQ